MIMKRARRVEKLKKGLSPTANIYYSIFAFFHKQAIEATPVFDESHFTYMAEAMEVFSEVLKISAEETREAAAIRADEDEEGGSNE